LTVILEHIHATNHAIQVVIANPIALRFHILSQSESFDQLIANLVAQHGFVAKGFRNGPAKQLAQALAVSCVGLFEFTGGDFLAVDRRRGRDLAAAEIGINAPERERNTDQKDNAVGNPSGYFISNCL
jgi:hypothetical protein